ncbi:DMT family transporter [Pseudomonas sp. NFXW11]|uniref:aromatic amino acid exporter YddG n=1 Tax=Pseudomonas sp. NFXW11 TaxID=2819531 RepID=UPI003CF19AFA
MTQTTTPSSTSQTTQTVGSATVIGVIAVFLWSCLALLTSFTSGIPPFELLALSFAVAFLASLGILGLRGAEGFRGWRQPWNVWATGFLGIFSYHALYFFALKAAPPAEASLIAYLWPLLIVLLASMTGGQTLHRRQLLGAILGLAGTAFIMQLRSQNSVGAMPLAGYAAALLCALVWSSYSVINRRFNNVPSSIIGGICGLVAVAGLIGHLAFETTVRPDTGQWVAIIALGLGPVGLAFFAWDHATKHGNLASLGALSYLAPLFSTLLLILVGQTDASPILLVPALLIITGAVIATSQQHKSRH